jgi:hypothetical protein
MTRKMYDSTNPNDIPPDSELVAGYVTGPYTWPADAWERFKAQGKKLVRIATQARYNTGNCLDVEKGDATPEEAPDWVLMRRAAGEIPSVYCNYLNSLPLVRAAFQQRGIAEPPYWVSRYDGVAVVPSGTVAKQHKGSGLTRGHWDESVVSDYWPGIDGKDNVTADVQIDQVPKISGAQIGRPNLEASYLWTDTYGFGRDNLANTNAIKAMVATVLANQKDDLTQQGVLDHLDASYTKLVSDIILPALADIKTAVASGAHEDANALLDAMAARLSKTV